MMKFRLALAALAILTAGACASSRSLDNSLSDLGGDAQLKAVLFTDRSYDYSDVDITLYEGRLLLTGSMRSDQGHEKLIANAWKAAGVDQVIDEVVVGEKTSFSQGLEDARIDQTLRAKLLASDKVRSGNYKIAVSNGAVHLIGAANSQAELDATLEIARTIKGVNKVVNHATVRHYQPG